MKNQQWLQKISLPLLISLGMASIIIFATILPIKSQQPIEINILIQALEAAQWQSLVTEFNQQQEKIRLKIIEAPNATNQVEDLYTASFLLGDSPYDLVYMDIVWVQKFAAAGWLQDLSEYLSPAVKAEFLPGDIAGGTYQDKLYRMPFRSDGGMLYYRTDLLEKAGYQPPETFTELLQISQDLQKQGLADWGYLWQGKQYEGLAAMFVEILEGFGAYWINPDTLEVGLDQPQAIQGVEFLQKTMEAQISPSGVTTYAEEETRRLFQSGNTVFLRNWPYVYALASQPDSPIQGKFAIKPMIHAPGKQSGACLGGWGLGISSTTPHPEAAWEVIEFITSEAVQRQFVLETGYVPSRKALFTDPTILSKYPHYEQLLQVVENSALRPPIAQYSQASDILQRYLSAALTKRLTATAAMEAAAAETRRLLSR